jgi:hypothetical protein
MVTTNVTTGNQIGDDCLQRFRGNGEAEHYPDHRLCQTVNEEVESNDRAIGDGKESRHQ